MDHTQSSRWWPSSSFLFKCYVVVSLAALVSLLNFDFLASSVAPTECVKSVVSTNHPKTPTATSPSDEFLPKSDSQLDALIPTDNEYACRNHSYTEGQWVENRWIVNDERCKLEPWSVEAFCQTLQGRSMLIVGDSINLQWYKGLNQFLHGTDYVMQQGQSLKNSVHGVHFTSTVCEGSRLTFLRNDYLRSEQVLDDLVTVKAINIPWFHLLPFHDILILNAGAHAQNLSEYARGMQDVRTHLQEELHYNGTVILRTTPRGHVNCSTTDQPIANVDSPEWKRFFPSESELYQKYQYDLFPRYNEIMMQEMEPDFTVLDVAKLTELRPDHHKSPPVDCLHYNTAGYVVYEEWTNLLYNALRGHL